MKQVLAALVLLFAAAAPAAAVESGYTLRAVELKAGPFFDAETLATLAEKTRVEIAARLGGWMRIRTRDGKEGWLRMLSVRLGDPGLKPTGGNILSAIGIGNRPRPQTTATVTTGVRGFSEEDLEQAQPNPAEVARMERFAADAAQLAGFARSGGLTPRPVSHFTEEGRPVEKKR